MKRYAGIFKSLMLKKQKRPKNNLISLISLAFARFSLHLFARVADSVGDYGFYFALCFYALRQWKICDFMADITDKMRFCILC